MTPILLLAVAALAADPTPVKDPVKLELSRFEGDWKIMKVEGADEEVKGRVVKFTSGTVNFGKGFEAKFTINPGKDPKWIDLDDGAGKPLPGIYTLDGDALVIYITTEYNSKVGPKRPTGFDTTKPDAAVGQVLHLERVKRK